MTVSVVISTFNGEKYILEQLESIRKQTKQPDEVLIRDDGSKDRTVNICRKYVQDHSLNNWIITINDRNIGWAENFKEGFKIAKGDLIFPCDQDDVWLPDKIENMCDFFDKNEKMDLLVGGTIKVFEENGRKKKERKRFSGKVKKLPFDKKFLFVDYPGCAYCFKKTFFEKIEKYEFENYPHDSLLIRMGRLLGTAYYWDSPVLYWRRHGNNATGIPVRSNKLMKSNIKYYINCLKKMKEYCSDNDEEKRRIKLIENNISFYEARLVAFEKKKIIGRDSLFTCLKYINYYPKWKSIIGDVVRIIH